MTESETIEDETYIWADRRFSDEVRQIRAVLGLSVGELASMLPVDARTVEQWEQGDRGPAPDMWAALDRLEARSWRHTWAGIGEAEDVPQGWRRQVEARRQAATDDTGPYFVAKARAVFAAAGGDPDRTAALAGWAHQARRIDAGFCGVLIGDDGTILAHTWQPRRARHHDAPWPQHIAISVTDPAHVAAVTPLIPMLGVIWGDAAAALERMTGQQVILVKAFDVAYGAGRFIKRV